MKLKQAVRIVTCPDEMRPSVRAAVKAGRIVGEEVARREAAFHDRHGRLPASCTCIPMTVHRMDEDQWPRLLERPYAVSSHYRWCPLYQWWQETGEVPTLDRVVTADAIAAAFHAGIERRRAQEAAAVERRQRRGWAAWDFGLSIRAGDHVEVVIPKHAISSLVLDDEVRMARVCTSDGDEIEVSYMPVDPDDDTDWRGMLAGLVDVWTVGS